MLEVRGILDRVKLVNFSSQFSHKRFHVSRRDHSDSGSRRVEVNREGDLVFQEAAIDSLKLAEPEEGLIEAGHHADTRGVAVGFHVLA